MKYSDTR